MINLFKKPAINQSLLNDLAELQERNAKRMEAIKAEMGSHYLLHPDNMKHRLSEPRPV